MLLLLLQRGVLCCWRHMQEQPHDKAPVARVMPVAGYSVRAICVSSAPGAAAAISKRLCTACGRCCSWYWYQSPQLPLPCSALAACHFLVGLAALWGMNMLQPCWRGTQTLLLLLLLQHMHDASKVGYPTGIAIAAVLGLMHQWHDCPWCCSSDAGSTVVAVAAAGAGSSTAVRCSNSSCCCCFTAADLHVI